jgi:hypothetical protein
VILKLWNQSWQIELRFHVWWQLDIGTEFISIQEFLPMFISYFRFCFEGGHRIELSNRLLYGFMLKQEAPFRELKKPSNIFLWQYCLQAYLFSISAKQDYPDLSFSVISQSFKSKDCKTKKRTLYQRQLAFSLWVDLFCYWWWSRSTRFALFHSKDL